MFFTDLGLKPTHESGVACCKTNIKKKQVVDLCKSNKTGSVAGIKIVDTYYTARQKARDIEKENLLILGGVKDVFGRWRRRMNWEVWKAKHSTSVKGKSSHWLGHVFCMPRDSVAKKALAESGGVWRWKDVTVEVGETWIQVVKNWKEWRKVVDKIDAMGLEGPTC